MSARWVAVGSETGERLHAVWVTHTRPIPDPLPRGPWPGEPMLAACGITVVLRSEAGPNGGRDWDRQANLDKCWHCYRRVDRP